MPAILYNKTLQIQSWFFIMANISWYNNICL